MNSYPPELLVQLAPVMFVAGLDPPPTPVDTPSPPPVAQTSTSPPPPGAPPTHRSTPSRSQDPFASLILRLRESLDAQRKPSVWAPDASKTFQIILVDRNVDFPPRKLAPPDDPHQSPYAAATAAHSPLSPLTPSSPLHPDGLIAPIWIRKHTALVPSVFVLFLKMYEAPSTSPRSPLEPPDADRERERADEERRRDLELAAEIAARKRSTGERNIKLTVVLIASRKMLDDPALDARLTFVRRQSGLDSRAALFVLSPVAPSELAEFVRSLQDALYEPAVEYYTAHSKRVRRKRNRHAQSFSSFAPSYTPLSPLGGAPARPLRPEGWTVRYEYKMACFAEFRREDEVALKHYQDAYASLLIMFGSTAILPPRTKRWAEAKVLADAINIKIVKLYLYNNEHALALSRHSGHMRRFSDFSRGWGIGEETFEFWSWLARQHRVLAELLERGLASTLILPSFSPEPRLPSAVGSPGTTTLELEGLTGGRAAGVNPSHALQHPGHYYYMAARCTEARRERFLASEGTSQGASAAPGLTNERKVDHLTIILELYTKAYELFKRYGAQSQGRLTLWIAGRIAMTYEQAGDTERACQFFSRIAKTYRRERWHDVLLPLLVRWHACAQKLGDTEVAVRLLVEMAGQGAETAQEELVSILQGSEPPSTESILIDQEDCEPLLDTNVVFWTPEVRVGEEASFQITLSTPEHIMLDKMPIQQIKISLGEGHKPIVLKHKDEAVDGSEQGVRLVKVGRVRLVKEGNDGGEESGSSSDEGDEDEEDEGVDEDDGEEDGSDDSGGDITETSLRWKAGEKLVLAGKISSDVPATLQVQSIEVTLQEGKWTIIVPHASFASHGHSVVTPRWLTSSKPLRFLPIGREHWSSVVVHHRPHQLALAFEHHEQALLDEDYPIVISVTNTDSRTLDVAIDALLQPTAFDGTDNYIVVDEQRSASLIKGVRLGTLAPGVSTQKTLHLFSTGAPGERVIDVSVQSTHRTKRMRDETARHKSGETPDTASESAEIDTGTQEGAENSTEETEEEENVEANEMLETLVVPALEALRVIYDVGYRRMMPRALLGGILDASVGPEDAPWGEHDAGEALVHATVQCAGPVGLKVDSAKLVREDGISARILDAFLDEAGEEMFEDEYLPGDEFGDSCRISLVPDEEEMSSGEYIPGPGYYEITWRRVLQGGNYGPPSTSLFALPTLQPPRDGLIGLLSVPSTAKLHVPTHMHLTIRNRHPSRTATVTVQLESDPQQQDGSTSLGGGILVAGLRTGRVPVLLPGMEYTLSWRIIPLECGSVRVPGVKVFDMRSAAADTGANGEEVEIVDVRTEWRGENAEESAGTVQPLPLKSTPRQGGEKAVRPPQCILVLP